MIEFDIPRSKGVAMADSNRFRFTTSRLEKLSCPAGKPSAYFYDTEVRGLVVYVSARSDARTFYLYRRVNGRPTRLRLGSYPHELSIDQARKEAQKAAGEVAKGNDPHKAKLAERSAMTFGSVFAKHLEHAKLHNKTWKDDEEKYNLYLRKWAKRRLSEIARDDVQALHARVGTENGKYAANRLLALVRHVFAKTAANLGYTGLNPAAGIEKFREKSRERFLDAAELERFFKALDDEPELFRDFFLVALLTGARRANVQAMRFEDVNFDRATWVIPDTKSGDAVTVPLVPEAVEVLQRRLADLGGGFVFPSRGATGHLVEVKGSWKRVVTRAGLKDVRVHDLRRTFGSWQAAAGVSLAVIGKSMGHRNQSTTAVYARLNIDPVRAAVSTATSAMLNAAGKKKVEE